VSLDPPLVSICVMRGSRRWSRLRTAPRLGLSFLGRGHQDLCRALASSDVDGFSGLDLTCTAEGAVLLPDATAWLDCTVYGEMEAGDHVIVLLRVQRLAARPSLSPLIFHSSRFHQLTPG
jgi:flavin reductase (DIM6/NTAB) family NADH-FMN oxidoreductase RutF